MRVEARRDVVLHPRPYLLNTDQIRNDQVPLIDDDPGQRLGDGWLLPAPLRAIVINDDGSITSHPGAPGLPETVARR